MCLPGLTCTFSNTMACSNVVMHACVPTNTSQLGGSCTDPQYSGPISKHCYSVTISKLSWVWWITNKSSLCGTAVNHNKKSIIVEKLQQHVAAWSNNMRVFHVLNHILKHLLSKAVIKIYTAVTSYANQIAVNVVCRGPTGDIRDEGVQFIFNIYTDINRNIFANKSQKHNTCVIEVC